VSSDPALVRAIAQRLAETADRQKVIEEVCLARNLIWDDARRLVDDAIETHYLDITRRQSPVLVTLAFLVFTGGVALTAWHLLGLLSFAIAALNPRTPELLKILQLYSGLFQTLSNFPAALTLFITGLGMMTGSLLGMKDVWLGWLDAWERRQQPVKEELLPLEAPLPTAPNPQQVYTLDGWSALPVDLPEALDMVLENLQSAADAPQIAEKLARQYGLSHPEAYAYIRQALRIRQAANEPSTSPVWMLLALAALVTGILWILQFILTASAYLSSLPPTLTGDVFWGSIQRSMEIGAYIQRFPLPFVLFLLGLALLASGYFALKTRWLAMLAWHPKQIPNPSEIENGHTETNVH
jgi:hypothetical protein